MAPSPDASHGRRRTSRQPERSPPRSRSCSSASATAAARSGRIAIRHAALSANVTASTAIASPGPPIAMRIPASAGPATLAMLRVNAEQRVGLLQAVGRDRLRDQADQRGHEDAAAVP